MDTATPPQARAPRWGQARRLAFIDLRLQYDGRINRTDLMDFFDVSAPQASADLGLYQEQAKGNMDYDASAKAYLAMPGFKPQYGRASASSYLDELYRLACGVVDRDESFVGFLPPTGIVATPARNISADEVSIWVKAVRDKRTLRVEYQSMEHDSPMNLTLCPHAFGFDGLRWHVRAWCFEREAFRDFAIGRLVVTGEATDTTTMHPSQDLGWTTKIDVLLVPNPNLTDSQQRAVEKDYGMQNGRLILSCRQAMLFYTLRHLNLLALQIDRDAARQHVIVENRMQVKEWLTQERPA